jgi:hypothetical protein
MYNSKNPEGGGDGVALNGANCKIEPIAMFFP